MFLSTVGKRKALIGKFAKAYLDDVEHKMERVKCLNPRSPGDLSLSLSNTMLSLQRRKVYETIRLKEREQHHPRKGVEKVASLVRHTNS
jgi:hypothetical protein